MPDTRRRYTRKKKVAVVMAAAASSVLAAAEEAGIPPSTVAYWVHQPEFASLRDETREARSETAQVISLLAADEIRKRIPTMDAKDLINLYGVMVEKSQLLSGQATGRTETRDLTSSMDDHEWESLQSLLREAAHVGD